MTLLVGNMGGNALKQYHTRRFTKSEYFDFDIMFQMQFRQHFGFLPLLIKSYKEKDSFGDADYLLDASLLPPNWTDILRDKFNLMPEQYVKNSNVVSIGVCNFQVDLIVTPHDEMEMAYNYFNYNDFSNLIGRMLHKLGVKLGHNGIWLIMRDSGNNNIIDEILLSRSYISALDILGLNPNPWIEGFHNLEQMFNYIASSKYFDPEIYALEHRSNTSRTRDRKRKTYHDFLQWVSYYDRAGNYRFANKSERGGYDIRHPYYETEVLTRWPWVQARVDAAISKDKIDKQFKKVYNGRIVQELTGLEGKELGQFMSVISRRLNMGTREDWISGPHDVVDIIKEEYAIFKS